MLVNVAHIVVIEIYACCMPHWNLATTLALYPGFLAYTLSLHF